MIKSIQIPLLFKKTFSISLSSKIHTDFILLSRGKRYTAKAVPYEPGIRHRQDILLENDDFTGEFDESEMDDRLDEIHTGKKFVEDYEETRRQKLRIQKKILSKKFFESRPQPPTLTYNERLCIKYLHKEDPVQWNIKTLSEGFPATPEIIKKILKSNVNYTPEQAKSIDLKVQKNWELLAEGKLDADPNLIEHLKKFINRREILLEQIKNEKFYLPEVKKEPVWNQGEMTNIITKYEKALQKLAKHSQAKDNSKLLGDGRSEKEGKSSLDLVHEEIEESLTHKELEAKDSFVLGDMINTYSKDITIEELQTKILKKADKKKKLTIMEKAILEDKLNIKPHENNMSFNKNMSISTKKEETESFIKEKIKPSLKKETNEVKVSSSTKNFKKEEPPPKFKLDIQNEKTQFFCETDIGNFLNKSQKESLTENDSDLKTQVIKKTAIDFSDPERLKRESLYYDEEVRHIKDTAFWNSGRTSEEKSIAEYKKSEQEKPSDIKTNHIQRSHVFAAEPYPEKIKIPKKMQGKGLIFKIKDCYYDDDGMFLYRVPGIFK